MGTQQILLIALGVVLVGIAVIVGISLSQASFADQIKDMAIKQMHEVGAMANAYRSRPTDIGGGGGSYKGFKLASQIKDDALAWTYDFRFGDDYLFVYLISKAVVYKNQRVYVLGFYKKGKLEYIRLYNPEDRRWDVIYRKS